MWCTLTKPLRVVKAMAANRISTKMRSRGRQISFMLWACWACREKPQQCIELVSQGQCFIAYSHLNDTCVSTEHNDCVPTGFHKPALTDFLATLGNSKQFIKILTYDEASLFDRWRTYWNLVKHCSFTNSDDVANSGEYTTICYYHTDYTTGTYS